VRVLIVTNMYPTAINPKAGTFIEQQITSLSKAGLKHRIVLIDRANQGMNQYLKTVSIVRQACRDYNPDIVHVMYGGILAAASTWAAYTICPRIVSFCGVDLLGANYGSRLYRLRTKLGVAASRFAAKNCEGIIVKSRNLFMGLPEEIDSSIVRIVPNGINLLRFKPMDRAVCRKQLGWDENTFTVLFSTTNPGNAKKRLILAEKAITLVKKRGYKIDLKGLNKVSHKEVPVWINASDVTLLTSMYDEGSPNIVKETLACNNPVVSLDVGDVKERIQNVSGCQLTGEDPDEIADALIRVINGKREIDGEKAMIGLSVEEIARKIINFYDLTLSNSK